jgi:hypothetical protein
MADTATIQARLSEAETALHSLMNGSRVEEIQALDGSRVRYAAADLEALRSYIAWLREELGAAQNPGQSRVFTVQTNRGLR